MDGRTADAIAVNGMLPGPTLRWSEGDDVILRVTNTLDEPTSIHWHGILLPYQMDGVPGLSFPGIAPGETFTYQFPIRQAGTYWYHSHSGLQEQLGHYGSIVIEPVRNENNFDREYVLVLSDWTFEQPHQLFRKLKALSHVYNRQQQTLVDLYKDSKRLGLRRAWAERAAWGAMRMNRTDIADVTGITYSYLVNGHTAAENWTALFEPGQRVRLRVINASAMTIFNLRIPGLPMTVVQSDGLDVMPVETDEFQIGVAETFDVIVTPTAGTYSIVAETIDRSGMARATLTSNPGDSAPVPARRERPTLTMRDMAMDHGEHHGHQHHGHDSPSMQHHPHEQGAGVVGLAMMPQNRLAEPPLGLESESHRVLTYTQLRSREPNPDVRQPERSIQLHLTGNMERYMWSFDGQKFSDVDDPIRFVQGERVRLELVNDTMMAHPIHLHGMFFDLVTSDDNHRPRKHTVVVKPGEKLAFDVTADAPGNWAFHCHLLYHMHAGMMRVVSVGAA